MSLQLEGRDVLIVSPHFDDVPLSLGQSLIDGELSRAHRVQVRVVFGRTNWTTRIHPTRRRALPVSVWRRSEELLAAARFGYTVRVLSMQEAILRNGSMDPDSFRGTEAVADHPLVDRITSTMRVWSASADVVLVPAGLGGHVDHRLVAAAGVRTVRAGAGSVAFYEDRPYVAYMQDAEIRDDLGELGLDLEAKDVSGPILAATQRTVRRIYRSQMDDYFIDAQRRDALSGRSERIWQPVDPSPVRR